MSMGHYKTAIVTGAASGIGEAVVKSLVHSGLSVFAVDKNLEGLQRLSSSFDCQTLHLNLLDTKEIYSELSNINCDVLINNAGLAHDLSNGFLEISAEKVDEMIAINLGAAIHVIRAVLPGMRERKRGHIIEMGSIAALYPLGLPIYSATKSAIHTLSQTLRMELIGTKIRHTEICAGRTSTNFFETAFPNENLRKEFVSQIDMLAPEDIASIMHFVINAPLNVNVSLVELTPVDQAPGGQILKNTTDP